MTGTFYLLGLRKQDVNTLTSNDAPYISQKERVGKLNSFGISQFHKSIIG